MIRLDKFLAENNYSKSREKAKKEILAGWVKINGERCIDVSKKIEGTEAVEVSRPGGEFVSRGGYKLERALSVLSIDVSGLTAADLGASTGGFTDCLLKHGAARVYAIDVGYGQLAYSLRTDNRVTVMERTNVRNLTPSSFQTEVDFITGDLSFISLTKIYPVLRALFPQKEGVLLVKPQFEARPNEHKKGVIKDKAIHATVLARLFVSLSGAGADIHGITYSPIRGPKGNIEFLAHLTISNEPKETVSAGRLQQCVDEAWENTAK